MKTSGYNSSSVIKSWFGPYGHRWPLEVLHLGYAMACIEVVLQESPEALSVYLETVEGWGRRGWQHMAEGWSSLLSYAERQELADEGLKTFARDMDGTMRGFADVMKADSLKGLMGDDDKKPLTEEEEQDGADLWYVMEHMMKFIYVGFNGKTAQSDNKYKVVPSTEPPWLIMILMHRIQADFTKTDPADIGRRYKLAKIDGKIIDMEEVLTKQKGSRLYRRFFTKKTPQKMKLVHDQIIKKRAWLWYQCRVANPGIEAFMSKEAENGNLKWDLKNIQKEIRGCDRALGYLARRTTEALV